jgi:putative ABC transport system permease protein
MRLNFYWPYATRSLLRGGQRTVLAIFCIAVGVMAIVALQLVGLSINNSLTGNIVTANGGDLRLTSAVSPLHTSDLNTFQQLKQSRQITDFATSYGIGATYTSPTGNLTTVSLLAVSSNFPLVGQPDFTKPSHNLRVQSVVTGKNVALSNIAASDLGVHVGSTVSLKTVPNNAGEPSLIVPVTVGAIFQSNGSFQGETAIVSASYLDSIPGPNGVTQPPSFDTVYMTVPSANLNSVKQELGSDYPNATLTSAQDLLKQRQQQVDQLRLFLQIVGLLALFIGGIGIINTMQVLLRRRRIEIAMLKTSGYQQVDLYALFGLEAGILGLLGGIVGTLLGLGASYLVAGIVANATQLSLPITLDGGTLLSGLLIGFFAALIFGLIPIVQASQIRPLSVLREMDESTTTSWLITGGLVALLSVLFVVLASTIIGNFVTSIFVVYGGTLLLFALASGFSLLVFVISKLPIYEKPNAKMLLWILGAFGGVLGAGVASAILIGVGFVANQIASRAGAGTVGSILIAATTGASLVLIGGSLVFLLATLVDAIIMFTPRSWKNTVMLAYRNMGRQRIRTTATLTALFVGVFGIGLVVVLGQGIKTGIDNAIATFVTRNVFVFVPANESQSLQTVISSAKGVDQSQTIVNTLAIVKPVSINGQPFAQVLASIHHESGQYRIGKGEFNAEVNSLQGYDLNSSQALKTISIVKGRNLGPADAGTNNVIASSRLELDPIKLQLGDTITVSNADGSITKTLTIVGFYDGNTTVALGGIFADTTLTTQLGGATLFEAYSLKVDPNRISTLRQSINQTVPGAILESTTDIATLINSILNNIIVMFSAIASLALISGLIIIANAVALAMLERRREIGILKSVGHTSTTILSTVLLENGLVGLLGSLVAMLLVGSAITVLATRVFKTSLGSSFGLTVLIIVLTSVVTMAISALVAWDAARVRPLEVLRYE